MRKELLDILGTKTPFRFLTVSERKELAQKFHREEYSAGEDIIHQNSYTNLCLYILESGLIETWNPDRREPFRRNVVNPGSFFGERSVLFDIPRYSSFRALQDIVCWSLQADDFFQLLQASRVFAQSLGNYLLAEQGVFSEFERFSAELNGGMTKGHVQMHKILPLYKELRPALHSGVATEDIDFSGLYYAVRRLPDNLTSTFAWLLTDDLPTEFTDPDTLFQRIETDARRRNVWQMIPGKSMVLLRSGVSDLVDFITCLCVYAVEAEKISMRLHNPKLVLKLHDFIQNQALHSSENEENRFLDSLNFRKHEITQLRKIWKHELPQRLFECLVQRENLSIKVRRQIHNYNSRRTELWTNQVAAATKELIGFDPNEMPDDWKVHIISSNAHSVTNCLNPLFIQNADNILAWGQETKQEESFLDWENPLDEVFALSRAYILAHPDFEKKINEPEWGIYRLRRTSSTGIQVQIINAEKLKCFELDPGIRCASKEPKTLIVNIDYAFGEQAADIIKNLIMLFGKNITSINVLGKAGALQGSRGDILIPNAFIEQQNDLFHPLMHTAPLDILRLQERLPDRSIHCGPLLTVSGTLLQNQKMLHFYKRIWRCIGLEMEGMYYYREIIKAVQLGVLNEDLALRFYYYVSDVPIEKRENLARRMAANEGIPPLYAITREILTAIFECGASDNCQACTEKSCD